MSNTAFALTCSVIAAVLGACLVTIAFRDRTARLIAYLSCLVEAAAPLFGRYVVVAFAVAGLIAAVAVAVGRRTRSRQG